MAEAKRDGNQVKTLVGSFNGAPVRMKVENATGYLKAKIYQTTLSAPAVDGSVAGHDGNSVPSALGSFNGTPKTLKVTNTGGYLRAVNS